MSYCEEVSESDSSSEWLSLVLSALLAGLALSESSLALLLVITYRGISLDVGLSMKDIFTGSLLSSAVMSCLM